MHIHRNGQLGAAVDPQPVNYPDQLESLRRQVEAAIDHWVPNAEERPQRLHAAMRYSLEAGGKRLRPVLLLATANLFERVCDPAPAAAAIECLHTYTLIHDDLPGVDDSDMRRGKPSCHQKFDTATAILAGDALLTLAFEILSRGYTQHPAVSNSLIQELAKTSGSRMLIGGQMEDILGENRILSEAELDYIHRNKTAALISGTMVMGAMTTTATEVDIRLIRETGLLLGMAFQIVDDVLDATGSEEVLGKSVGQDAVAGKNTHVSLHGLDASREAARELTAKAIQSIRSLPSDTGFLEHMIEKMGKRVS